MEGHPAFLDCLAYLDPAELTRCGLPAEIVRRFIMASTDGPLESVIIKCPVGHFFCAPVEFLSLQSNRVASARERIPWITPASYGEPDENRRP
jgi:hypothetical protein